MGGQAISDCTSPNLRNMEVKSLCIDLMPDKEIHGQRDTHTDRQTHGHTDKMTIKLEIRKRTVHIKLQSQEKNSQEKN